MHFNSPPERKRRKDCLFQKECFYPLKKKQLSPAKFLFLDYFHFDILLPLLMIYKGGLFSLSCLRFKENFFFTHTFLKEQTGKFYNIVKNRKKELIQKISITDWERSFICF